MKAFQMRGYNVVMLCAICYCLYSLKSVKNTYGGVLLLAKLLALTCNFTKSSSSPWMFFAFFKLYKWYQIVQNVSGWAHYFNWLFHKLCKDNADILYLDYFSVLRCLVYNFVNYLKKAKQCRIIDLSCKFTRVDMYQHYQLSKMFQHCRKNLA